MLNRILLSFKKRFGKDKKYYTLLDQIFGIYPNNIELYKLALIHRSASLFLDDGTPINNERLEFLGDAILESIVSDFLFITFPEKNEGFLTQIRSKIVSRVTLNEIAVTLGLDKYIIVQYSSNHIQKHLYGDALEAMIGAIYLDKGYDYVNRLVINGILTKHLSLDDITQIETDFKSRMIEWCQKQRKEVVFDTVPSDQFNDHTPNFICRILVADKVMGTGEGSSKKEAEQMAAHQAYLAIKRKKDSKDKPHKEGESTPSPENQPLASSDSDRDEMMRTPSDL